MTEERLHTFQELGLPDEMAQQLAEAGILSPTPVQVQAIPAMLEGRDGVLVSPTGTGKTLAYLLPVLQRLDGGLRQTQALILAPTQELAMQIVREAERYGAPLGIKTTALIGGASLARQLERMKAKPALVVGTPGRVREVASRGKLQLSFIRHVVVDETDRVFSLGGREDVEKLLRQCARDRQTVFVSATRSEAMREAEELWLRDPWVAEVGAGDSASGLPATIQHWYFVCDKRDKIDLVRRLVHHLRMKPVLLFLNDIEKIGELSAKLTYEGVMVDTLYGDTPGNQRKEALRRFRAGRTTLLIATDVAARGLDVPGLPLVIQFEPALDADHYVHRAGRTGRMGRKGLSITLMTPQEQFIAGKLSRQLGIQMEKKILYEGRVLPPEEASVRKRQHGVARAAAAEAKAAAVRKPVAVTAVPAEIPPVKPAAKLAGKAAAKPAAPASKGGKAKADRLRDRKNKGAPRWLKEKREMSPNPKNN